MKPPWHLIVKYFYTQHLSWFPIDFFSLNSVCLYFLSNIFQIENYINLSRMMEHISKERNKSLKLSYKGSNFWVFCKIIKNLLNKREIIWDILFTVISFPVDKKSYLKFYYLKILHAICWLWNVISSGCLQIPFVLDRYLAFPIFQ